MATKYRTPIQKRIRVLISSLYGLNLGGCKPIYCASFYEINDRQESNRFTQLAPEDSSATSIGIILNEHITLCNSII